MQAALTFRPQKYPPCNRPHSSAERMETIRLRAELARVTIKRDIWGKATACFAKVQR